ncbi:hypothetical protein [Serratia marcescens]|uniref:hypothetical protein n=1 Tax=Serratia marcescens TaxID=615 RepID=UPI00146CAF4C|nr:hypothetical protein [Serratia marcescens]NMT27328.1 hypothetical protein [Serratia marcescens]
MDKLSELSKPVAWIIGEESIEEFKRGYETFVVRGDDVDSTEETMKLYSQEYVSAIIQRAERLDSMLTESVQALKAAEQRNAELEAKLARFGDVRQHYLAGYDDGHSRGLNAGRLYKEDTGMVMHRHASANAYAAEGDE